MANREITRTWKIKKFFLLVLLPTGTGIVTVPGNADTGTANGSPFLFFNRYIHFIPLSWFLGLFVSFMQEVTQLKIAHALNIENQLRKLSNDVDKLMTIASQHGVKIKELVSISANSVSQVEFMSAITTTRFQTLNVVKSISTKAESKPEGGNPLVEIDSRTDDNELKQIKNNIQHLENEQNSMNFKSNMETKRLDNELKVSRKELFELKSYIHVLESKLERFVDAVETAGISTNISFVEKGDSKDTHLVQQVMTFTDEIESPKSSHKSERNIQNGDFQTEENVDETLGTSSLQSKEILMLPAGSDSIDSSNSAAKKYNRSYTKFQAQHHDNLRVLDEFGSLTVKTDPSLVKSSNEKKKGSVSFVPIPENLQLDSSTSNKNPVVFPLKPSDQREIRDLTDVKFIDPVQECSISLSTEEIMNSVAQQVIQKVTSVLHIQSLAKELGSSFVDNVLTNFDDISQAHIVSSCKTNRREDHNKSSTLLVDAVVQTELSENQDVEKRDKAKKPKEFDDEIDDEIYGKSFKNRKSSFALDDVYGAGRREGNNIFFSKSLSSSPVKKKSQELKEALRETDNQNPFQELSDLNNQVDLSHLLRKKNLELDQHLSAGKDHPQPSAGSSTARELSQPERNTSSPANNFKLEDSFVISDEKSIDDVSSTDYGLAIGDIFIERISLIEPIEFEELSVSVPSPTEEKRVRFSDNDGQPLSKEMNNFALGGYANESFSSTSIDQKLNTTPTTHSLVLPAEGKQDGNLDRTLVGHLNIKSSGIKEISYPIHHTNSASPVVQHLPSNSEAKVDNSTALPISSYYFFTKDEIRKHPITIYIMQELQESNKKKFTKLCEQINQRLSLIDKHTIYLTNQFNSLSQKLDSVILQSQSSQRFNQKIIVTCKGLYDSYNEIQSINEDLLHPIHTFMSQQKDHLLSQEVTLRNLQLEYEQLAKEIKDHINSHRPAFARSSSKPELNQLHGDEIAELLNADAEKADSFLYESNQNLMLYNLELVRQDIKQITLDLTNSKHKQEVFSAQLDKILNSTSNNFIVKKCQGSPDKQNSNNIKPTEFKEMVLKCLNDFRIENKQELPVIFQEYFEEMDLMKKTIQICYHLIDSQ